MRIQLRQIQAKGNQRLYFLKKLRSFHMKSQTLVLFYQSVIQSVLCFCSTVWFSGLTEQNKKKLARIVSQSSKVTGIPLTKVEEIVKSAACSKLHIILKDESHPFHRELVLNRSGRIRLPKVRTERFRTSFLVWASKCYNSNFVR